MPNRIYDIEVTQDHIDKGTIPPSDSLFYFGDSTNPLALAALDAGFQEQQFPFSGFLLISWVAPDTFVSQKMLSSGWILCGRMARMLLNLLLFRSNGDKSMSKKLRGKHDRYQ